MQRLFAILQWHVRPLLASTISLLEEPRACLSPHSLHKLRTQRTGTFSAVKSKNAAKSALERTNCVFIFVWISQHYLLGLYKIFFHIEVFVHESILLVSPPPTCTAHTITILLHGYCAKYDAPPDPRFIQALHHTILAIAISCKGQLRTQAEHTTDGCLCPQASRRMRPSLRWRSWTWPTWLPRRLSRRLPRFSTCNTTPPRYV